MTSSQMVLPTRIVHVPRYPVRTKSLVSYSCPIDKTGAFVVLELKVSKGYDRVVGQLLRYVNWVRQNLADPGQRVRGIIVCRTMSDDLRLACASIKDVELFEYQLSVSVTKVPALELPGL